MFTMDPPRSGIFATHARMQCVTLTKFSRISASWPLSFTSVNAASKPPPALLTSTSTVSSAADPFADRVAVAYVEQLGVGVTAVGDDLLGGARQPVGITVADGEVGAEPRERRRDLRADPLRGAGDHRPPAGQQYGLRRDRHRERRLASPS